LGLLAELPFSSELDADIGKDPGADAQKKTKCCESVILMQRKMGGLFPIFEI